MADNEIAEMQFNVVPAQVSAPNLDDILNNIEAMLAPYNEVSVDAKTYTVAKKVRTDLNKQIKQISDIRKDTENRILGDWPDIKLKMMEIEKAGKSASEKIKVQLDAVDEQAKIDRRQQIDREIQKIADEYNFAPNAIKFDDRWLNKTAKWKETEAAVRMQFEELKQERELHELRVSQVEVKAKELGIDAGGYIRLLHSEDLSMVLEKMEQDVKQREAEIQARREAELEQEQRHQEQLAEATQVGDKFVDNDTGEVIPEAIEVPRHDYNLVFRSITSNQANYLYNELEKLLKPAGVIFEMKEM